MIKIATVTLRETQARYSVYAVPGTAGEYAVWVANPGYACYCSCKSRKFNPHRRCKHMVQLQAELDQQRREAPLYRKQPFDILK